MASGADTATNVLRETAQACYRPVWEAGAAYAQVHARIGKTTDLVEMMRNVVALILAAEHLNEVAQEAAKSGRSALTQVMSETGATSIQTENQTVYISRKAAWVSVDEPDKVPTEYVRQPPPAPDKRLIKAAIEAGEAVPGCSLIRPNDVQLVIKKRNP